MNTPRVMNLHNILDTEGSYKPSSPSNGQKRKRDSFAYTPPRQNKNPRNSLRRASSRLGSVSPAAKDHQAKICVSTPPMSGLVSRLRHQAENAVGYKPSTSIMDWILDSMSPYMDYAEDDLLEIAEKSEDLRTLRSRVYTWDEFSLSRYWYDQALVWNRVSVAVGASNNAQRMVDHPESFERSTAWWEGEEAGRCGAVAN